MKKLLVGASLILMAAGCSESGSEQEIEMKNGDGDSVGVATLSANDDSVKVKLNLQGLPPGDHAIHFHEKASCEAPDFKSAGDHFNPDGKEHGLMNAKGAHAGDLPNISVAEDGTAELELEAEHAELSEDDDGLLKDGGTALVIHEKADDGMSQPAGDAGDRIACGEIK